MQALILIDIQHDFVDGSLGSPEALTIIPKVNALIQTFRDKPLFFTVDAHPIDHSSFAATHNLPDFTIKEGSVKWPVHCVKGSHGAEIYREIVVPFDAKICEKAQDPEIDAYSAFFDEKGRPSSSLDSLLKEFDIKNIAFCGIAGDFCVDKTLLDALKLGYKVEVYSDAVAFIDPTKREETLKKWENHGAVIKKVPEIQ